MGWHIIKVALNQDNVRTVSTSRVHSRRVYVPSLTLRESSAPEESGDISDSVSRDGSVTMGHRRLFEDLGGVSLIPCEVVILPGHATHFLRGL